MYPHLNLHETEIYFGSESFEQIGTYISKKFSGRKIVILTDEHVAALWVENLVTNIDVLSRAEIIEIPAGEENKTIEICQGVWEALSEYEIGRHDLIINLGGGMISDLGGFVASVYKRGIQFINIPTTLLSQVDASIGGKTGIDLGHLKNQIGTFSNPCAVFINEEFLTTLPIEQIKSGMAEMFKHALISSEQHWKELVQTNLENGVSPKLIYQSIQVKHQIVLSDYLEKNERKKLNFGHTIGHAIEGFLLNTPQQILHGHAIALGIVAESFISMKIGYLTSVEFEIINVEMRKRFNFNLQLNETHLMQLMKNDKKNTTGKISFTLLKKIGEAIINVEVEESLILESIQFLKSK